MPQQQQSSNLVALLTGASRGIGVVVAMQLAQRGVRIALHYRNNRNAAESALARLAGSGHALFDADLADPAATTRFSVRPLRTRPQRPAFGSASSRLRGASLYSSTTPASPSCPRL